MPIDLGYTCVCKRHNAGRPHALSRSAWYKHLKAAEKEEEKQAIRAGKLSLDLHAQLQAHVDTHGASSSSSGPSQNIVASGADSTSSCLSKRPNDSDAAQTSQKRVRLATPSSSDGGQSGRDEEEPSAPAGDDDWDFYAGQGDRDDDGQGRAPVADEEGPSAPAGDDDWDFYAGQGDRDNTGQGHRDFDGQGDGDFDGQVDRQGDEQVDGENNLPEHRVSPVPQLDEPNRNSWEFILALRSASLDDAVEKLDEEAKNNLQDPPRAPPNIIDPIIRHAISTYYALEHSSQSAYEHIRASTARPRKNARNLCAFRWLKQVNTAGSTNEFNAYYSKLNEAQIQSYNTEINQLERDAGWTKNGDIVDGTMY
ncbi:uncharacterized protein EDB91DRAFT_1255930 [Suillus paluster]|uniref:uncharacterized protein n=1 Tax=Suillus paluster TaxID=48578 RepID=UPI001B87B6DD|nr:uncharacterized protein EDB91DRAFT_1255930 [Suillus paluster]KAG1722733.1 hypothetical protein EDB91DRAFT_1255930 [Suillus paluster]